MWHRSNIRQTNLIPQGSIALWLGFALALTVIAGCKKNIQASMEIEPTKSTVVNKNGKVTEQWGYNSGPSGDEGNYRYLYYYDSLDRLSIERRYHFDDGNINRTIIDSMDYYDIKYYYQDNKIYLEERYFQVLNDDGKITGHELGYTRNYITGESKAIQ